MDEASTQEGVRELANRDTSAARVTFQESARTGYLPAVTAQGIIALWSGDVNAARREWERSASGGDVAAQILLSLDADDSVEFGSHEFARALMRADDQYRKDEEAREFVLGGCGPPWIQGMGSRPCDRGGAGQPLILP